MQLKNLILNLEGKYLATMFETRSLQFITKQARTAG